MPDSNQKGVAHRHERPMPSDRFLPRNNPRRRFDESLMTPIVRESQFILPDNETFGLNDLRSLVDEIGNEGEE